MTRHPIPRKPFSAAVVGGGISGLTAAYRLLTRYPDADVTVIEAGDRLGGCLRSSTLGGHLAGTADVGAEASLYVRPETRDLAAELGAELEFPSREHGSQLFVNAGMQPIPRGTLMGVPSSPEALAGIASAAGMERARCESVRASVPLSDGESFDISVGRFLAARLGDEVVDRLVDPLLAGVYAGRARDLSLAATLPALLPAAEQGLSVYSEVRRILAQRTGERGANVPGTQTQEAPPVFMTLDGGISTLVDLLRSRIEELGGRISTGAVATALRCEGPRYILETGDERAATACDITILAVPPHEAGRLLGQLARTAPADSTELSSAADDLRAIPAASSAVVTALLELDGRLEGSGFLVAPSERTFIKASTYASNKWPWLAVKVPAGQAVVRMSVGRYGDTPEVWEQCGDSEIAQRAVAEWLRLTGRSDRLIHAEVQRWIAALPQYLPGHFRRIARIDAAVSAMPGLALVGNAYGGVGIPACIRRVDEELARVAPQPGDRDATDDENR